VVRNEIREDKKDEDFCFEKQHLNVNDFTVDVI
jgi:hypothetical protein